MPPYLEMVTSGLCTRTISVFVYLPILSSDRFVMICPTIYLSFFLSNLLIDLSVYLPIYLIC